MGKIFIKILGSIQNQKRASFIVLAILIAVALVYFIFEKLITKMIMILGWSGAILGGILAVLIVLSFILKKKLPAPSSAPPGN